ncbi:hypothetical protein OOT46_00890 [Aquabacterium sp. A7-Y]|uniref:calcium-binding protein n=1 Tax=Aquabacterium sp. A7-Y TaxID=1349605 RepID=UPI00223E4440|nr:calcium-binding protein [Aquabacterium sp. A7-Y]MCW7536410.1 hypothetical protein [Aquabacterium sp. A7-Y]
MATINGTEGDDSLADVAAGESSSFNSNWSGGEDVMRGGTGDDTYHINSQGDRVVERGGEGHDVVVSRLYNYTLAPNVEVLQLSNAPTEQVEFPDGHVEDRPAAYIGLGNAMDNEISGNWNGNTLMGLDGNDTIYGRDGDDLLFGGNGDDFLSGGSDGDIYGRDDFLVGGNGNDTLFGSRGKDVLLGGNGNDTLIGYADGDADHMDGGRGNDIYREVEAIDTVTEEDRGGVDTVYAYDSFTLSANIENLVLTDWARESDGRGNARANQITGNQWTNVLRGEGGNDTLNGDAGFDTLDGGAGNDTLYAHMLGDVLTGGSGGDRFVFGLERPSDAYHHTITDFSHRHDTLVLSDALDQLMAGGVANGLVGLQFDGGAAAGHRLSVSSFFKGAGATGQAADSLAGLYVDTASGALWYNPTSGTGGDAWLLAKVGTGAAAALDTSDFIYGA